MEAPLSIKNIIIWLVWPVGLFAFMVFCFITCSNKGMIGDKAGHRNISAWRNHLPDMPEKWINAYDKGAVINDNQLYDLKAIPSLYLLDRDKKVLLKDVSPESTEAYLQGNFLRTGAESK